MTERSQFWTTGTTGDGTSTYTEANVMDWLRKTFLYDPTTQCVLKGVGNDLAVAGVASPVTVDTGSAYVYGFWYENTASVDVAVSTPLIGTTGHRIVLRISWGVTRTVRIALLSSADGTADIPAVTQNAGTTYEVSLATLTITTGGVITVTDDRHYCHPNVMISTAMLDNLVVTAAKIAADAVETAKIKDAQVTEAKIAAGFGLIPTGGKFIGIFNVACPSGWTRVAAFDGLTLKGAAAYGGTGGSATHTHTGPSHTHTGPSHTHTGPSHTHTGPSHTHDQNIGGAWPNSTVPTEYIVERSDNHAMCLGPGAGSNSYNWLQAGVSAAGTGATGAAGTGATGAEGTGATGAGGTGASGATSSWPPYIEVVFCSKN